MYTNMADANSLPVTFDDDLLAALQSILTNLIDLSLQLKQAHWNVVGRRFRTVHLELDEIVIPVRNALDEVAERIVTIGGSADGDAAQVVDHSALTPFPKGSIADDVAVDAIAERLQTVIYGAREDLATIGEKDSVSEDLIIGVLATLEKRHWMLRAATTNV